MNLLANDIKPPPPLLAPPPPWLFMYIFKAICAAEATALCLEASGCTFP
jgi:hypothetical protein